MLTSNQRSDLHVAVYEYLSKNFEGTAEKFSEECSDDLGRTGSMKDVLERKWVSIVRLQKKIVELEATVEQLNGELKNVSKMIKTTANAADAENLMPKFPPSKKFPGHKGIVKAVSFHPIFALLASAGEDGSIKLWDFESGSYQGSLKGHTGAVNDVAFDPNGSLLASASSDFTVKIWDIDLKQCIKTFSGHDHVVSSVRWRAEGDFLLSGSYDGSLKLWELASGYCKQTWNGHEDWIKRAVFNEVGNKMATASKDQSLILWKENESEPVAYFYGHTHIVETVMFVEGSVAKKLIRGAKWNPEAVKDSNEGLSAIELSKKKLMEGKSDPKEEEEMLKNLDFLVSGSRDKTIRIWSCSTSNCLLTLEGHNGWINGLAMHHSGLYFYSVSDDKSIRVWSFKKGKVHARVEGAHSNFVTDIESHPAYLSVVTCGVDASVHLWECK